MSVKGELSSPLLLLPLAGRQAEKLFGQHAGGAGPTPREYAVLDAVARADGLNQTAIMTATGLDRSGTADVVRPMVADRLQRRRRTSATFASTQCGLRRKGRKQLRAGQAAAPRRKRPPCAFNADRIGDLNCSASEPIRK